MDLAQVLEGVRTMEDLPALADEIRQAVAQQKPKLHGFLIRRHGLYTWGEDLDMARRHVEVFEFLFEVVGRRL